MGRTVSRAAAVVTMLVVAWLAGCVNAPALPGTGDGRASTPTLACEGDCLVVIDQGTRWEPAVTVDPTDGRRIVAASMDQGYDENGQRYSWPLAHVSHDGGATWTTLRLPMGPDVPSDHPLATPDQADDPAILFLPDGTLVYTALVYTSPSFDRRGPFMTAASIVLWRSADGGRTFSDAQVLHAGSGVVTFAPRDAGVVGYDKQWLAAGADGSVLMVWTRNREFTPECVGSCTDTFAEASTDAGRTWSEPSLVYHGVSSGAFPLIMDDGSWVVSYRETDDAAVHVAVSDDRGRTWITNTTIDSTTKFPVLAKTIGPGRSGERIYMAYPMTDQRDGQPDVPQTVTLRWSDDGGHTWSDALALERSDAAARTSPALAATPEGGAIVTYWLPTGEDDALTARLRAVGVAPDGAVSDPLTLDTHEGSTRTTGDYMGLVALPDGQGAFAVWNAKHGKDHVITGARLAT